MDRDLELPLDRVTYRDGQLLASRSLRDDAGAQARFRRLHLRGLHDTWGIAVGLDVALAASKQAVVVGPGYAMDAVGADLVLAETMEVALPALAGVVVLVLVAPDAPGCAGPPDRADVCAGSGGLDPRTERPSFRWRRPPHVNPRTDVALAAVTIAGGLVQGPVDLRPRRYARTLHRPHIATGSTEPGHGGWQTWSAGNEEDLGLTIRVDTEPAGFVQAACYLACLRGDLGDAASGWTSKRTSLGAGALGFITDSGPDAFTYCVPRGTAPFGLTVTPAEAESREWVVEWVGVEAGEACAPLIDLSHLFTLTPIEGGA